MIYNLFGLSIYLWKFSTDTLLILNLNNVIQGIVLSSLRTRFQEHSNRPYGESEIQQWLNGAQKDRRKAVDVRWDDAENDWCSCYSFSFWKDRICVLRGWSFVQLQFDRYYPERRSSTAKATTTAAPFITTLPTETVTTTAASAPLRGDVTGNVEFSVEDAQWLLKYYTEKYIAGKDVTWDDFVGKKTQSLPRLIWKRIPSLNRNWSDIVNARQCRAFRCFIVIYVSDFAYWEKSELFSVCLYWSCALPKRTLEQRNNCADFWLCLW